jgi:acyl-CoA thioester hydrolase
MELTNNHYKKTIIVLPEHLDDINHVNNVVYVQWMQDIAGEHWNSVATDKLKQDCYG